MSDETQALVEAVSDACRRHPSDTATGDGSTWNAPLWSALEQIGITLLSVPEKHGGAGGDLGMAGAVLQTLGEHAADVPFAETAVLAGWLLASSGASIPDGPLSAAVAGPHVALREGPDGWRIDGEVARVPLARHVSHLVLLVGDRVVILDTPDVQIRPGTNLAGEARDTVLLDQVPVRTDQVHAVSPGSGLDAAAFAARGAVARVQLIAGAARRALQMAIAYTAERHQFGRSIDSFQSVQHQIATMASEALLCKVAAEAATTALELGAEGPERRLAVAAAKAAVGSSGGVVARLAHQVHGAIGVTEEHDLRLCSTRIWSWRDEFTGTREATGQVGAIAATAGPDGLWALLTAR